MEILNNVFSNANLKKKKKTELSVVPLWHRGIMVSLFMQHKNKKMYRHDLCMHVIFNQNIFCHLKFHIVIRLRWYEISIICDVRLG